ncbi:MAG: potassium channel family protein [Acidimicrobiia bacterium]
MHIIVIGCGRVGSGLAGNLEAAGHSVAIIDRNAAALRRLPASFQGRKVVGFGFDREHLLEAGIETAGALAAVTNGDNSNILAARIARENFGVERVVARIYDPRRAIIYERLGIPTVATVSWTVDQVQRRLLPGDQPSEWLDPSGKVAIIERVLPDQWAGRKLGALDEPGRFQLGTITRMGAAEVVRPDAIGQQGDRLHFFANTDAIAELDRRLIQPGGH